MQVHSALPHCLLWLSDVYGAVQSSAQRAHYPPLPATLLSAGLSKSAPFTWARQSLGVVARLGHAAGQ